MTKTELMALLDTRELARARYDRCSIANTAGLSSEQRVDLDLAYQQAGNAYFTAAAAYEAALLEYSK